MERTVEAFDVFAADGYFDRREIRDMRAMLLDARQVVRVVDVSDQLSRTIGRATSERQIKRVTDAYQREVDEMPEPLEAA